MARWLYIIQIDERKTVRTSVVVGEKPQGTLVVSIPKPLRENGLPWRGGDMVEELYDREQDILVLRRVAGEEARM